MKISELISALQKIQEQYGDLECIIDDEIYKYKIVDQIDIIDLQKWYKNNYTFVENSCLLR